LTSFDKYAKFKTVIIVTLELHHNYRRIENTMDYFNSADELINAFDIKNNVNYEKITPLNDCKVGFSTQRKYPTHIRFHPPKKENGDDDTVALIHVVYKHPNEYKSQKENDYKIPFIIEIVTYSRYRSKHFDYNFEDEDCPTKESIEKSKLTPQPIDLNYNNEFFYDHRSEIFVDVNGNIISGIEILDKVFKDHCNTVHLFKGLRFKVKLKSQSLLINFLSLLVNVSIWKLNYFFGRTLDKGDSFSAYLKGYKKENLKKLSTDSLNIFGYNTARRVVILFCSLVVAGYVLYFIFGIENGYIKRIFSNNFLALTHSIFILWFLDVVMPVLLFHFINIIIKTRSKLMYRQFSGFFN